MPKLLGGRTAGVFLHERDSSRLQCLLNFVVAVGWPIRRGSRLIVLPMERKVQALRTQIRGRCCILMAHKWRRREKPLERSTVVLGHPIQKGLLLVSVLFWILYLVRLAVAL